MPRTLLSMITAAALLGSGATTALAQPVETHNERDNAFVDHHWSPDTFAVWPLRDDRPEQTAVVSWSDWMVFGDAVSHTPGVRFVLNEMAASGIRRVWWRTFGGGWALYPSQVPGVTTGNYAGQGADYSDFDSLGEAVDYGHGLGLEVYAWFTPLEEAHGWPDNVRSHYVDAHRDQWDLTVSGQEAGVPSFFYEDYRNYKAALAAEMVERYDVDGLVLDFERGGAPNRSDQFGYIPELKAAFQRETGLDADRIEPTDPRWRAFRARYVGAFVRSVRETVDALDREVELVMMVPAHRLLTAHWNAPKWAEAGLIDRVVLVSHGREGWGTATDRADELARIAETFDVPVDAVVYHLKGSEAQTHRRARQLLAAGFDRLVWFETTYLHFRDGYDMPLGLACPDQATIVSPMMDLAHGGEAVVMSPGAWTLRLAGSDEVIARGGAGVSAARVDLPRTTGESHLRFDVTLPEGGEAAGLAVEIVATGRDGQVKRFQTDETWHALDRNGRRHEVTTLARPGVPPLLHNLRGARDTW